MMNLEILTQITFRKEYNLYACKGKLFVQVAMERQPKVPFLLLTCTILTSSCV